MSEHQDFCNDLCYDLALEYQAEIQYRQHASQLKGCYSLFEEDMLVHADQEAHHANTLNELIDYLGYIPSTEVATVQTSTDTCEMLKQDLDAEETAITRYKERICQARDLGLYEIEPFLMHILKEEMHHKFDLLDLIEDKE
jgi:bacterioferritin